MVLGQSGRCQPDSLARRMGVAPRERTPLPPEGVPWPGQLTESSVEVVGEVSNGSMLSGMSGREGQRGHRVGPARGPDEGQVSFSPLPRVLIPGIPSKSACRSSLPGAGSKCDTSFSCSTDLRSACPSTSCGLYHNPTSDILQPPAVYLHSGQGSWVPSVGLLAAPNNAIRGAELKMPEPQSERQPCVTVHLHCAPGPSIKPYAFNHSD
ncbi:hypothetical protein DPEC_G00272210 [Dallia pectoralis]|uniref:Uncharacterized protein n=1 Tax=Dallia pectoralis TaxID=75939 RepID=A0ACC2FPZ2_DALPE|nr:hypothetical protein DPEC_G00272210 [Dallia pectoralis]